MVAAVLVHAALSTLPDPLGIPALAVPFAQTTWLFLLAPRLARG
jgi:urea transporter